MRAYFITVKNTWAEYAVYRLSFVMWRVRWVIQRMVIYFLWWAVYASGDIIFGYTEKTMLTYVIMSNIIATFTLGTRTMEIGDVINKGNLSNHLLRPWSFFTYYLARDTADKLLNFFCGLFEISILIIILKPPVFFQTDFGLIMMTVFAGIIGAFCYFFFSILIGFIGFWSQDVWAPRFLSFVIMEFFAGGLFPLDILPGTLYTIAAKLPFGFFVYFPIKVYLGQLSSADLTAGFMTGLFWLMFFVFFVRFVWHKGLAVYQAEGR